jgi:general secretion pathway protein I
VKGFSLIEVMVALAVLALSMGVLLQANVTTIASVDRIDGMTQATLLARSKMLDIERKLYKEGFKADAEELKGTFEEEGHSEIKWEASIKPVKVQTSKLSEMAQQFAGFGDALGGKDKDKNAKSKTPTPSANTPSSGPSVDNGDPLAMIRPLLDPVAQGISQNLRFVKLDVSWPEGVKRRGSFSVTAMITSKALQQSQQQLTGGAVPAAGGSVNGMTVPQQQTAPAGTPGATTGATTATPSPLGISH